MLAPPKYHRQKTKYTFSIDPVLFASSRNRCTLWVPIVASFNSAYLSLNDTPCAQIALVSCKCNHNVGVSLALELLDPRLRLVQWRLSTNENGRLIQLAKWSKNLRQFCTIYNARQQTYLFWSLRSEWYHRQQRRSWRCGNTWAPNSVRCPQFPFWSIVVGDVSWVQLRRKRNIMSWKKKWIIS